MKRLLITLLAVSHIVLAHSHGDSPVSCSKPSGYVTLHYELSPTQVNQTIEANITLQSEPDSKIIEYEMVLSQGLEEMDQKVERIEEATSERITINLKLKVTQEGRYYVTLYTQAYSIYDSQNIRYKSLVVPIEVGSVATPRRRNRDNTQEHLKIYHGMESIQ